MDCNPLICQWIYIFFFFYLNLNKNGIEHSKMWLQESCILKNASSCRTEVSGVDVKQYDFAAKEEVSVPPCG